jgi:sialate O-acetylesterase
MRLQQELGVPVGLIEAAVAGSPSGPFLSQSAFDADPEIQKAAARADSRNPLAARMKEYGATLAKWQKETDAAKAAGTLETRLPRHPRSPVPYARQMTGNSYEKLIRPLIPYAIRGVLWDQGEGGAVDGPIWQPMVMAALIRSWRADWGQGEFPWLSVQKPSGGGCALTPDNPMNKGAMAFAPLPKDPPPTEYFASLRQDGYRIMQNPNTFLVINSDLAPGVHPPNKSGYGARDVQVALGAVYGKPVEYYGPVYQSFKVESSKARISYSHVGRGLTVPPGQPLQGFCVAGADKKFHWAAAVLDGQTVVLSSPDVHDPVAVRYAWTWPLAWANLFNRDGLPALGFRTDTW